jgi:hypothetical protein
MGFQIKVNVPVAMEILHKKINVKVVMLHALLVKMEIYQTNA